MKRVTIIGGGYAGTALARALDDVAEVRLVEARDRFVHNVGAIRAVADPTLLPRIMLPYDRLLKCGAVVHGQAAAVSEHGVTLDDGTAIEGDFVVVATGSRYARPFKPQGAATAAFAEASRAAHEALRAAGRVAIVGGGAVGTELAGEIASLFPGKAVTLLAATPSLLHGYPPRLSSLLLAQLQAKGVTVRTGVEVLNLADASAPFAGPLDTAQGPVDADLVFPALGARPVNGLLRALPGAIADRTGRVQLDRWLRPAGAANIFAIGDAAATGDPMTIVAITRQVPWLAKTLKALIGGRRIDSLPAYAPWTQPVILVPLGPRDGASVLPLGKGVTLGRRTTAMLKGKDLFIPRYRRDFRLQPA